MRGIDHTVCRAESYGAARKRKGRLTGSRPDSESGFEASAAAPDIPRNLHRLQMDLSHGTIVLWAFRAAHEHASKPSGDVMKRLSSALILLVALLCFAADARSDTARDHYAAGVAKAKKGDYDGALSEFDTAIKLDPSRAVAYFARGLTRQHKNDFSGAMADFSEAIELKPDYSDAYDGRGNARADQGDLEGAIADYGKAIELNPTNARPYSNRGRARLHKGDLNGALTDLNRAIQLSPTSVPPYLNRGVVKRKLGDLKGSNDDFAKAVELNPKAEDVLKASGYSLTR
jgi:tetratricopeptide (TPR) repeat protein